ALDDRWEDDMPTNAAGGPAVLMSPLAPRSTSSPPMVMRARPPGGQPGGAPRGLLPAAGLFLDGHAFAVFRRRYQVGGGQGERGPQQQTGPPGRGRPSQGCAGQRGRDGSSHGIGAGRLMSSGATSAARPSATVSTKIAPSWAVRKATSASPAWRAARPTA